MTGSSPITAPMLMIACRRIHAITPAVATRTNWSRDADQPVAGPAEQGEKTRMTSVPGSRAPRR
jgi:hypothetical protein